MPLNLHLLRIFCVVAEQRSFSRAAAALFISQPAVSRAVRELEHQLELPLFERGGGGTRNARGVRLTESGAALFDHARGIFALERAASDEVRARVGLRQGRLIVGASTTIAGYWLPPYAAEFARRHPEIQIKVRVGNTSTIGQALIDCEVDVAVVEGEVQDARIEAQHWRDEELQIIAPSAMSLARKRKLSLADLNAPVWLVREPGSGTRAITDRLMGTYGLEPTRTLEYGSNEGIARAVAGGLGIAMLPARVARDLTNIGELRVLALPAPAATPLTRPLFLLQLRVRPPSPLVRSFWELLTEAAQIR